MDKSMIDAASEGALMDKNLVVARQLISNIATNYQQYGTKMVATSKVVANEAFVFMVVDKQRLENKLRELTSLVRQLAIGQQQNVIIANEPRLYGICYAPDHPTYVCSTL